MNVASCVTTHLIKPTAITAYREGMVRDAKALIDDGMTSKSAWLEVIDAKVTDLTAEQDRILESAIAAYAETPAGKKAAKSRKAAPAPDAPVVVTEEARQQARDRAAVAFERDYAAAQGSVYWNGAGDDFNNARSKGTPKFENLRREVQADWFKTWVDAQGDAEGLWAPIYNAAQQFEVDNDLREDTSTSEQRKSDPANAGTTGGGSGAVRSTAEVAGSSVPGASQKEGAPGAKQPRTFRVAPKVEKSTTQEGAGTNAADLVADLKKFLRGDILGRKVKVVQSMADLPGALRSMMQMSKDEKVQGLVFDGDIAYLIADNIAPGEGRSVFMHEVGAHLGLQKLLPKFVYDEIVSRVATWAGKNDNSLESRIARKAMERVAAAGTSNEQTETELVAYFISEAIKAGVNPTSANPTGPTATLISRVYQAFKTALQKLMGVETSKFGAQDMVDLAYGAAQIQLRYGSVEGIKAAVAAKKANDTNPASGTRQATETSDGQTTASARSDGEARTVEPSVAGDTGMEADGVADAGTPNVVDMTARRAQQLVDEENAETKKMRDDTAAVARYQDVKKLSETIYPWLESQVQAVDKARKLYDFAPPVDTNADIGRALARFDEIAKSAYVGVHGDLQYYGGPSEGNAFTGVRNATYGIENDGAEIQRSVSEYLRAAAEYRATLSNRSPRQKAMAAEIDKVLNNVQQVQFSKSGSPAIDSIPTAVNSFLDTLKDAGKWVRLRGMFTEDLVNLAAKAIPSARKYLESMTAIQTERTKMERDVSNVLDGFRELPKHEKGTGPTSVNSILQDSTMSRKWAFKPDWVQGKGGAQVDVAVDAALAARFKALSPAGQDLVKQVFKHGHDTLAQMQRAVIDNATSEFDPEIAAAKAVGKDEEVAKLEAKKAKYLTDFQSMLDLRSGWPYAPLKRFGNHVVLGVSQAYIEAKKNDDVKRMQELQKDGDHYHVSFADSKREAKAYAARLEEQFPGGFVSASPKSEDNDLLYGGRDVLTAFQRLRKLAKDSAEMDPNIDQKAQGRIDDMMRDLYLTLLSETSARKGEINRKNVAGADKDMMRAFATQGRATAHFIAGMKMNGSIVDNLRDMRNEAGDYTTGRGDRLEYFNEILRRHSMNLEYAPNPIVDKAMASTSIWMLLSNPSYFLTNATQPFVVSIPMLAAKHGYARSWQSMTRAYGDLLPVLKGGPLDEASYSRLPKDVRAAIEALADKGVIDTLLGTELGRFESEQDSAMRHVDHVVNKLRGVAEKVESINRLSTAISAYRMERERGSSDADAIDYAAKIIKDTHGDYSGFNAPRLMRSGVGRLATQFRKFQLIQLTMFAKLTHAAFADAPSDERQIARKALALNLTHMFALGGVMGMPGFAAIAWVVGKAFPDDDEPDDPEATLRRLVGDKHLADLLVRGAPKLAGADISGRVGAGGMLSILPYTDIDLSRKGYADIAVGLMGPFFGGLAPKAVDGLGMISKGDYWKGLEALMPTGVANLLKSARFADQGMTQRNGDQVLSSDDIGALDILSQAVGLPSNTLTDRQTLASGQFNADRFYKDRTAALKTAYANAMRENDIDALRDVRQDWQRTQEARKKLGYPVQPMSQLLKAPQERAKREKDVVAGVETSKKNLGFTRAQAEVTSEE